MGDYDSDDEKSQVEKLRHAKVPRGMFVSGWDDDADELIEEDKDPQCEWSPNGIVTNIFW